MGKKSTMLLKFPRSRALLLSWIQLWKLCKPKSLPPHPKFSYVLLSSLNAHTLKIPNVKKPSREGTYGGVACFPLSNLVGAGSYHQTRHCSLGRSTIVPSHDAHHSLSSLLFHAFSTGQSSTWVLVHFSLRSSDESEIPRCRLGPPAIKMIFQRQGPNK